MSECIEAAADYMEKKVQVVQTKKAIVVSLFFIYCVYIAAVFAKHVLRNCQDNQNPEKAKKWNDLGEKMAKLQYNMIDKCFFFYFLMMLSSQLMPTVFAAIISYFYWGALACNAVGCLFENLRKLRMVGMIIMCIMVCCLWFGLVFNDWCNMFYFASEFSLEYRA